MWGAEMASNSFVSWRDMTVLTFNGQFDTNIRTGEDYHTLELGSLLGLLPTRRPKARAPAFIPSIYNSFDARCHVVQQAQGQFVALTGDIDKGNFPIVEVINLTRDLFGPAPAIFIYSTGSATPEDKRWRIVVPLHEPVSFERWNEAQKAFFAYMEKNGVPMDKSLAGAGQPVYLPNVPSKGRDEDGNPLFYETYLAGETGVLL